MEDKVIFNKFYNSIICCNDGIVYYNDVILYTHSTYFKSLKEQTNNMKININYKKIEVLYFINWIGEENNVKLSEEDNKQLEIYDLISLSLTIKNEGFFIHCFKKFLLNSSPSNEGRIEKIATLFYDETRIKLLKLIIKTDVFVNADPFIEIRYFKFLKYIYYNVYNYKLKINIIKLITPITPKNNHSILYIIEHMFGLKELTNFRPIY